MLNFLLEAVGGFFHRIEFSVTHMNSIQWSVVSVVAVAVGFLALRSKPLG